MLPGDRFGSYCIERPLGAGGMAETFLAVRRGPGNFEQRVCLKRILPVYAQDQQFMQLFLDEARLIACMRHMHIVQVYEFGAHEGTYYLALEWIDGLDLRALLHELRSLGMPLPYALVALIAYEVASALDYAHTLEVDDTTHGVIHRDVSPGNILLSRSGEVKLADFGIAKTPLHNHVTQSGMIKGKIPYVSPEQALGMAIDARSDLFSLGVVLYEMIAGERPFDGPTDAATLLRITTGAYTPLAERTPNVPAPLAALIERLLSRQPEQRFASASDLLTTLADILPPATARRELAALVRRFSRSQTLPPTAPAIATPPAPSTPSADLPPDAALALAISASGPRRTLHLKLTGAMLAVALLSTAGWTLYRWRSAASSARLTRPARAAVVPSPPARSSPPAKPSRPATPTPAVAVAAAALEAPPPLPNLARPSPPAVQPPPERQSKGARGRLHVIALPWGKVWIDGKPAGNSPLRLDLPSGSHRVAVGFEGPQTQTRVKLAAGEQRDIILRIQRQNSR